MYGTVAHVRPKPGEAEALIKMSQDWTRSRAPKARGFVADYLFQSEKNPDEYLLVAIFEDRESYFANAQDPEQDRWYQQMRSHLQEDPVWEDGEIVFAQTAS